VTTQQIANLYSQGDYGIYNVMAKKYGAKGDGSTDDTAAIQAAINACPTGGTVYLPLPPVYYLITAPLIITKSLSFRGIGVFTAIAPLSVVPYFATPDEPPYLYGSVIVQATAATDAIQITGTALTVNMSDFGIRFADAIRHVNTGHGINYTPSTLYESYHDQGLQNSTWRNVMVFGHDGNHYAFYLVNPLLCAFRDIFSWGGGLFYAYGDSALSNNGNIVGSNWFGFLYCNGTANGIMLDAREVNSNFGQLNLVALTRPQVNIGNATALFPETTPPAGSPYNQYNFYAERVPSIIIDQPDFEPSAAGAGQAQVTFPAIPYRISTESPFGQYSAKPYNFDVPALADRRMTQPNLPNGWQVLNTAGAVVTAAAGANAGSTPPAPVLVSGQFGPYSGSVTCGTGTGSTAGALVKVNAAPGNHYIINITPTNTATAALGTPYATKTSSYFTINVPNAPTDGQPNTTYAYDYSIRIDG
jgi:hypothetical protein